MFGSNHQNKNGSGIEGVKKMKRTRKNMRRGFSLLEIMLVLVILVVVGGIVAVNLGGVQDRAFQQTAKSEIQNYKKFLQMYKLNVGSLPSSLDALHEQPGDLADPTKWMQIVEEPIKPDPWGRPYQYKLSGDKFEIRSLGPDGQENTEDDITS
jgi:general secretion pathway protein G